MSDILTVLDIGGFAGLVLAPAVLGLGIAFRGLDFPDLGIEASLMMGAAVTAISLRAGAPIPVSILLGLGVGGIVGLVTASIHVGLGISKLLAGVLVLAMAYSVGLHVMGGSNVSLLGLDGLFEAALARQVASAGSAGVVHYGRLIVIGIIVALAFLFLSFLLNSMIGLRIRAVGCNAEFSRGIGVSVAKYTLLGLAISNMAAGLSGGLLAMHQGFADIGMGQGILVTTIASLAIGERVLNWFPSTSRVAKLLLSAVVGSVVYQILLVTALRIGVPAADMRLLSALLVLAFLALQGRTKQSRQVARGY